MSRLNKIEQMLFGEYRMAVKNGMIVGRNVSVMGGCNFGSEPYLITIEDDVRISDGVTFLTHDGGTWAFRDQAEYVDIIKYGKIYIGARTFIGCNSTIMPGVHIGERCVVGAGSVVTKDVPDGTVVCGIPARALMSTEEYAQKCLQNQIPYDKERYQKDRKKYLLEWLK